MAVARYSAETSQAVSDGGAPRSIPMGMSATAIIEEFTGFKIDPRIIGAISLRSNVSSVGMERPGLVRRVSQVMRG
ncbi:hypothetical protein GCM10009608_03490 [Pseudonocardia alaniniphila]